MNTPLGGQGSSSQGRIGIIKPREQVRQVLHGARYGPIVDGPRSFGDQGVLRVGEIASNTAIALGSQGDNGGLTNPDPVIGMERLQIRATGLIGEGTDRSVPEPRVATPLSLNKAQEGWQQLGFADTRTAEAGQALGGKEAHACLGVR